MPTTLAERLRAERHRHFVGREAEVALFVDALNTDPWPFAVLCINGPGGVGKTTLTEEYARRAQTAGLQVVRLDGRLVEAAPAGILASLAEELGAEGPAQLWPLLERLPQRWMLVLENYELLAALDGWFREWLCPRLPATCLVLIVSRHPLGRPWRADAGWRQLARSIPLRNLSPDAGRTYLAGRGLDPARAGAIIDFTHGHPLALSLAADTCAERPDLSFHLEKAPDLVTSLLEVFLDEVRQPAQRAALEVCAMVRFTTEDLLSALVPGGDGPALFHWLRGLSFIEMGPLGLWPHELLRETLTVELRWRNPQQRADLHRLAQSYYQRRLERATPQEAQRLLADYIFLHRENPVVAPFFDLRGATGGFIDAAQPGDAAAIRAMVAAHEGPQSADWADRWLAECLDDFWVCRGENGVATGFLVLHPLEVGGAPAGDPAVERARAFLASRAPLRAGERATLFRWWMAAEGYQTVGPVQSMVFVQAVRHYLTTPGLAYTFFPVAEADFWAPVFAYADLARLPEADFSVGGRSWGMYGHDWRRVPPTAWLDLLGERELETTPPAPPSRDGAPTVVPLDRESFEQAVKLALKHLTQSAELSQSPLLRSRLVLESGDRQGTDRERAQRLRDLIAGTIDELAAGRREEKLHRALVLTFVKPAGTQELAAERLGVPFSTYRRHLTRGVELVTERLWQRELGD